MKKNNYINVVLTMILTLLSINCIWSQSNDQKRSILEKSDISTLKLLRKTFEIQQKSEKQRAIQKAKDLQWDIFTSNPNGSFDELMSLLPDGTPLYFALQNVDAAISTRTNHLQVNGSLNLNLTGSGMLGGIWDGGPLRTTHQEFGGRAVVGDGVIELNNNSFHMTHVTGTVAASGVVPTAKGMATQTNIRSFDWTNDLSEVVNEILNNGLLLSNHSYGFRLINLPTWFVGAYSNSSRNWDQIHHAAPYYLMVTSAGNDGNNTNAEPNFFGFDKLSGNKTSKNNLVIGNAQDATVTQNGTLVSVQISSSSSQGPTDDNRIKPDIAGNGTQVFSSNSQSDNDYATYSGTSMSGPNVMGTLLLLQQYYEQLNGRFMRSSTIKGLVCHTANDAGAVGPDPVFGWGLLNAKYAAETIAENGLKSFIGEEILENNEVFTMQVESNGLEPLLASITWTDLPGIANSGSLNDTTPALVNDLDIRITRNTDTFFPWKLAPFATNLATRNSDNAVDNVERIQIDNPVAGIYTITVSHKGTLVQNQQNFSLIVTGTSSAFAILPQGEDPIVCNLETLQIPVQINKTTNEPVTLSAAGLPEGTFISFSNNPITETSQVTATLSNLNNLDAGIYNFTLSGNGGAETETRNLQFKLYRADFEPMELLSPANEAIGIATATYFEWESNINIESYIFQLSENPNFEDLLVDLETTETSILSENLEMNKVYFWRVIPKNRCGLGVDVEVYSFQTGTIVCESNTTFSGTDLSNAVIGDFAGAQGEVPIVVNQNFSIAKIEVLVDISHTWVQDLTLYLEGPTEIGSPRFRLIQESCGGEDDILATFSDAGISIQCGQNPAIFGTFKPVDPLANFNNLMSEGTWKVIAIDNYNTDGGSIDSASLVFCKSTAVNQNITFNTNLIQTEPNSFKIINATEIEANTPNLTQEDHTYTLVNLPQKGQLKLNNIILGLGDTFSQADIDFGAISYENQQTEDTTDALILNISNTQNSWLPNQDVLIQIGEPLSQSEFDISDYKIFPNPTHGVVFVQLPSGDNPSQLSIYDMQGRIIQNFTTQDSLFELNLNYFPDGLYILHIVHENHKIIHKISLKRN
jgi:subtilisin-like proprotein convertase family protein